jgi:hypothetical protein
MDNIDGWDWKKNLAYFRITRTLYAFVVPWICPSKNLNRPGLAFPIQIGWTGRIPGEKSAVSVMARAC